MVTVHMSHDLGSDSSPLVLRVGAAYGDFPSDYVAGPEVSGAYSSSEADLAVEIGFPLMLFITGQDGTTKVHKDTVISAYFTFVGGSEALVPVFKATIEEFSHLVPHDVVDGDYLVWNSLGEFAPGSTMGAVMHRTDTLGTVAAGSLS